MVSVQATNIPPKENVSYSKNTQTEESGGDAMPSRGSRLAGFDYYTLTYDDLDDGYEEDSLPGLGNFNSYSLRSNFFELISNNNNRLSVHFTMDVTGPVLRGETIAVKSKIIYNRG